MTNISYFTVFHFKSTCLNSFNIFSYFLDGITLSSTLGTGFGYAVLFYHLLITVAVPNQLCLLFLTVYHFDP